MKQLVRSLAAIALVFASPAAAYDLMQNGGFETASLSAWQTFNQGASGGQGSWYANNGSNGTYSGLPTSVPPAGAWQAVADNSGRAAAILYQDNATSSGTPAVVQPTTVTQDVTPLAGQTVRLRVALVATNGPLIAGIDQVRLEVSPFSFHVNAVQGFDHGRARWADFDGDGDFEFSQMGSDAGGYLKWSITWWQPLGEHEARWDGRNRGGQRVSAACISAGSAPARSALRAGWSWDPRRPSAGHQAHRPGAQGTCGRAAIRDLAARSDAG
jgi:hypothetical protein